MPICDSQLYTCVLVTSEIGSKLPSSRAGPFDSYASASLDASLCQFYGSSRKGLQGCSTLAATSALTLAAPKRFQLSLTACECRPAQAFPRRWRRSCFLRVLSGLLETQGSQTSLLHVCDWWLK